MAKKLIIYWKLFSMSKDVAKKAECEGGKTYTVEHKRTEFPEDKNLQEAKDEIIKEHGVRPSVNMLKGMVTEHTFAEIVSWKIARPAEPARIETENYEEQTLL